MRTTVSSKQIIGVDGVRSFACLGVICAHLFQETGTSPGNFLESILAAGGNGVQVFFVLSGFLLSLPFWKAYSNKSGMPDLWLYALSRLGRIVPAFYCCVIILSLIHKTYTTRWGIFSSLTLLTFTNSFIRATYMPDWDRPLWSIGIELQFYVMLPLFAVGMFRCRSAAWVRFYCVATMVALTLGQYFLLQAAPTLERLIGDPAIFQANAWSTQRNAFVLFTHFLFGFLAADLYLQLSNRLAGRKTSGPPPTRGAFNRFDLLALAAIIAMATIGAHEVFPYRLIPHMELGWPVFPALAALLLGVLPFSGVVGVWMNRRFLQWTAKLSYALYLWHLPIIQGLRAVWPTEFHDRLDTFLFSGVVLLCAYTVAQCSYSLIEQPALDWVQSFKDKRRKPNAEALPDPVETQPLASTQTEPQ